MHVNKVIETPSGTIQFEGELSEKETDLVLKVGLTVLLQAGAFPFFPKEEQNVVDLGEIKLND